MQFYSYHSAKSFCNASKYCLWRFSILIIWLFSIGHVYADTSESVLYIDEKGNISIGATVKAKSFETEAGVSLAAIQNAVNRLMPIGTIMAYGGDTSNAEVVKQLEEQGWLPCDGRPVSRQAYDDLFNVINTAYGAGDASTTFQVPDFRGRFLRGADQGTKRDPDAGSRRAEPGGGNSGDKVGSVQDDQFASHKHTFQAWHGSGIHGSSVGDPPAMASWIGGYNSALKDVLATGGTETRPKNVNVNWIIKAKHLLPPVPSP